MWKRSLWFLRVFRGSKLHDAQLHTDLYLGNWTPVKAAENSCSGGLVFSCLHFLWRGIRDESVVVEVNVSGTKNVNTFQEEDLWSFRLSFFFFFCSNCRATCLSCSPSAQPASAEGLQLRPIPSALSGLMKLRNEPVVSEWRVLFKSAAFSPSPP